MPFSQPDDSLEPEYQAAYQSWKLNPDPHFTGALLRTVQPSIDRAITAHVGAPNPLLKSHARRMALGAIQSYDPSRGVKLNTHIVNQLQSLKRVSRQQQQPLQLPERVSLDHGRLQAAESALQTDLGRSPSAIELADYSGLSTARIGRLRRLTQPVAEGQLQRGTDEAASDFTPAVSGGGNTNHWAEMLHADSDPVDQVILEMTLGLHGQRPSSNQQIARKLRLTQGRVSQRKAVLQQRLNEFSGSGLF